MAPVVKGIGSIFGSILGGAPAPPKPPKPPAVMPVPDDDAILADQTRQIQMRQALSGRQSTILSGGADSGASTKLGG